MYDESILFLSWYSDAPALLLYGIGLIPPGYLGLTLTPQGALDLGLFVISICNL